MVKKLPANAGDAASIPGSGRSRGMGDDNLLQYSFLGHSRTEKPSRLQSAHGVSKSRTRLSD